MAEDHFSMSPRSRREFLGTTALAAGALGLPFQEAARPTPAPTPRYRRVNVTDPAAKRSLDSYKKAIRAMLALPTTDPRNWYRYALIHTLDCPHGNWWFMPWHRGYIGWFETICRELSGDPEFALPYWDWTALPQVPDVMYDDVLTPSHPAYLATYPEFQARFKDIVAKASYWKRTVTSDGFDEDTQYGQLLNRGIRIADDLWFDIGDDPRGMFFFARAHARGLTKDAPQLDGPTAKAVSLQTLLDALSPRDFLTFGSARTFNHSGLTGFGVLEGLPHNRVHNCVGGVIVDAQGHAKDVGGFMQANLSPVDPLFFLHHSNIDRLWDLWTRKQQTRGYPILPAPGPDFDMWSSEPFLFYIDAQGRPVGNASAGDYAAIGKFAYDYEPGSGEEVASDRGTPGLAGAELQTFKAEIPPQAGTAPVLSGHVAVPASLLERAGTKGGPTILAKITLALPPSGHHTNHVVLVNAPADAEGHHDSPHYAGTLSMFGHHTVHCPVTFTVPLSMPLLALGANKQLRTTEPLHIRVVPQARHHRGVARRQGTAEVLSIVVEAH